MVEAWLVGVGGEEGTARSESDDEGGQIPPHPCALGRREALCRERDVRSSPRGVCESGSRESETCRPRRMLGRRGGGAEFGGDKLAEAVPFDWEDARATHLLWEGGREERGSLERRGCLRSPGGHRRMEDCEDSRGGYAGWFIFDVGGSRCTFSLSITFALADQAFSQHTAVITAVGSPTSIPADGQPYPIAALVSLTVVEQSQGSLPVEKTYDLAAMSKGELWIYRPVGLVEFTGSEIAASWPPSCEAWQVGELE